MRKQTSTTIVLGAIATVIVATMSMASSRPTSSGAAQETIVTSASLDALASSRGDATEQSVASNDADRAARAALEAVGEGKVLDVDRDLESGATWEVEVILDDGTLVDVLLDDKFRVLNVGGEREPGERPDDSNEGHDDNPGDGEGDDD